MLAFLKAVALILLGMLGLLLIVVLASFRIDYDENGKKIISLFWGAIKIDEGKNKVNVLGNLVAVDGENETVKVAGIAEVDGKSETVNVSNGDILVEGKEGLVKVKKELVKEVNEDNVILNNNFDSKMLAAVISLKKLKDDEIKIEGKKVGEDETYLHINAQKKGKIVVDVDLNL